MVVSGDFRDGMDEHQPYKHIKLAINTYPINISIFCYKLGIFIYVYIHSYIHIYIYIHIYTYIYIPLDTHDILMNSWLKLTMALPGSRGSFWRHQHPLFGRSAKSWGIMLWSQEKKTPKISCSLLFTKVLPLIPAISSLITGILVDLHVGNDMKHDVLDFIEILCIFEGLGSCSAKIGSWYPTKI